MKQPAGITVAKTNSQATIRTLPTGMRWWNQNINYQVW